MELFLYKQEFLGDLDLKELLYQLGIKSDDDICIHSEFYKIGKPLLRKEELCEVVSNLFLEVCLRGTILMPTFTYSFCNNEVFSLQDSPSKMGILSEYFRLKSGVKRTKCPIFSFAVYGANTSDYCNISNEVLGKNSVYEKLIKYGGKIILFGNQYKGYTFFHYLEALFKISYRYIKAFKGIIEDLDKKYSHEVFYSVRKLEISSEIDYIKLSMFLKENQCLKVLPFGGGEVGVIDLEKAKMCIGEKISINEKYFLV